MRVLYLTTELPYPLASGFLRHYHFLRALGQRHAITYLTLTRRTEVSSETRQALTPLVKDMQVFGIPDPSEPQLVKAAKRIPVVGRHVQRALRLRWAAQQMKRTVQELVRREAFDLAFFSGLGHVGMITKPGYMVHAPRTGDVVKEEKLDSWRRESFVGAVRPDPQGVQLAKRVELATEAVAGG